MGVFTDTVTVYQKQTAEGAEAWKKTVVHGVQWSYRTDKINNNGRISVAVYASVTFPEGTYENLGLLSFGEEDAVVLGEIEDEVGGGNGYRLSELLKKYPKAGIIQSVNDNSNRDFLPNVKVVVS